MGGALRTSRGMLVNAPAEPSVDSPALTETLAALTLATDAANGQPPETALRTVLLADGLARALGSTKAVRRDAALTALLRYLGCTASSALEAEGFDGDDVAARAAFAAADLERPGDVVPVVLRR